jgi:hypothetical protein
MTLREDITSIAESIQGEGHPDDQLDRLVTDGHARYHWYIEALSQASGSGERDVIARVLRDPDRTIAEAAIVQYIDRTASRFLSPQSFAEWAEKIADLLDGHDFARRRVAEWLLFKRIMSRGEDHNGLREASDWLQRKVSQEATSPTVLAELAQYGRTKRVRNTARSRARE